MTGTIDQEILTQEGKPSRTAAINSDTARTES